MKPDIQTRLHIEQFINRFYEKVRNDDLIAYLFNDVAKVDWEKHMPRMHDFWEQIIFQNNTYGGNPMQPHLVLHHHSPLSKEHFDRWLQLFFETVDELHEGPIAEFTKQRAKSIADVMQAKLFSSEFN